MLNEGYASSLPQDASQSQRSPRIGAACRRRRGLRRAVRAGSDGATTVVAPGHASPVASQAATNTSALSRHQHLQRRAQRRRRDHGHRATSSPPFHRRRSRAGQGSGFVYDTDGHIVTNQHVVDGATRSRSRSGTARRTPATLVGSDASTDTRGDQGRRARVDAARRSPSATRRAVEVGDGVVAIGSPFGLEETVTSRHRQRAAPADDLAEQLHDRRLDPDRRRDQPRQLRRPAARTCRAR